MRPLGSLLLSALVAATPGPGFAAGTVRAAAEGKIAPASAPGGAGVGSVSEASSAWTGPGAPALLPSSLPNPIDPVVFQEAEAVGVEPRAVAPVPAADPASALVGPARRPAAAGPTLAPAAETVRLPASAIRAAAGEPNIPGARAPAGREGPFNAAAPETGSGGESAGPAPSEADGADGTLFFDGARRIGRSLLSPLRGAIHRLRRGWRGEDKIPGFPGEVGQTLRIEGKPYALEAAREAPEGQSLFVDRRASHEPTLIRFYSAEQAGRYELQRAALLELAKTDIPHYPLVASNDAGRVLVQRSFEEASSFALKAGRDMSYSQWTALPDLLYRLVGLGKTVDLSPENLAWSHWRGHWAIKDAESFEDGTAWDALGQWLLGGRAASFGADPVELLAAVRGRFGPDAAAWKRIVAEAAGIPEAKRLLDALGRRDAARPPPPALEFRASRAPNDWLADRLIDEREMGKRFGFYPLKAKGSNLHFDKGKLNTSIAKVGSEESPWARKISSPEIIRNELFMRKVVHRWFGAYFDAPWSVARFNGFDSYMMMEFVEGSHYGGGRRMDDARRAALGVLVNAFGLTDMNLGNIMSARGKDKPVLLDFEQALSERGPVTNRIPDQGLLSELPWVDSGGRIEPEVFHGAIAGWRALFAKPETRAELKTMLLESGFEQAQAESLLARFARNTDRLSYTLQADAEFANYFYRDGR